MRKLTVSIALLGLVACNPNGGTTAVEVDKAITIAVGQTAEDFIQSNQGYDIQIDRQPAGLNFYEYRWPATSSSSVIVSLAEHSFQIPNVLSVMAREDAEKPEAGLAKFSVNAGIGPESTISHEEARLFMVDYIKTLTDRGWRVVIPYESPRLSGEDAFRYHEEVTYHDLPVDYVPSLDEWMRITWAYWRLHANNTFLTINMKRDPKRMSSDAPGAYFLALTIESKEEFAKGHVLPTDRQRWQDLWVGNVKELKRIRYEKERELEERGFSIFTDYEEPLFLPEDR